MKSTHRSVAFPRASCLSVVRLVGRRSRVPIRSDVSSASDMQHLPGMLGFGAQTESHAEDSGGWLTHPNDKPV